MDAPVWLQDEPEILALLNVVLDRFDQQSGEARSRAIVLPAQRHLTRLARGDEQADQVWALVQSLSHLDVLAIRAGKRNAYDAEWHNARLAFTPASEHVLREWLNRPPSQSQTQLWRQAVEQHAHLFPAGCEALLTRRIALRDRTAQEIVAALATLAAVQRSATLRQLSTRAFWGNSKVLDERRDLVAALFPQLQIRDRPILVDIYLPERSDSVLFVENQDNYDAVIEGELAAGSGSTVVYSAGFRSAARGIRNPRGARLHFDGPGMERREEFRCWWLETAVSTQPLFFWGDLDFAGMQILKSLRQRFGEVHAWRPGYEPMLAELVGAGSGNRPGTSQVDPVTTGCAYADAVLLPAVRAHGYWDQERIGD
jgi:hypothetical protein